jgi:hypothetical protein
MPLHISASISHLQGESLTKEKLQPSFFLALCTLSAQDYATLVMLGTRSFLSIL